MEEDVIQNEYLMTPQHRVHRLLSVRQKVFMPKFRILKIHTVRKHSVKRCIKYVYQCYKNIKH